MARPAPDSLTLLLVEDDPDLAETVGDYLAGMGHRVEFADNGAQGLALALERPVDVVILDVSLPRLEGWEVCRRLRASAPRHVPVLMLTARDRLADKLEGFEAGADDYLTKPFDLAELEARCRVLARRHRIGHTHELLLGELRIDRQRQEAARAGIPLKLHPLGYRILLILAEAHPRIVPRSELVERLWGDEPPETDALRTHLYLLRQALDRPFDRPMLCTVHSVGFRLDTGP